jgi:hypothetical protein
MKPAEILLGVSYQPLYENYLFSMMPPVALWTTPALTNNAHTQTV